MGTKQLALKDMPSLVTVEELAALLRTSPEAIYQMNYHRSGPRVQRVNGRVLFRREDVAAWLEAQVSSDA